MKSGIKIMSSGSGFTDASIMVSIDNTKYCFNMGNGIHRQSLGSSHSKPSEASVLFYTHLGPSAQADLLNYILRHKTDIAIIGPNGLTENLLGYRYFFSRRGRTFYVTECSSEGEQYRFDDGHLKVYPIIISPNETVSLNSNVVVPPPTTSTNELEEKNTNESILKELNSRKELKYIFDKVFGPVITASRESMRVNTDSMKSFYDWTLLRGGYLFSSTGSQFKMEEIEHYAAYRLLKEDNISNGRSNVDISSYKPSRSKEIKKFLFDTNDSDIYQPIPPTERENDYWCLESRHFRIVSRLSKSLRLNDVEKREMVRKRMNIYLKDPIYGPVNSHAILPPNVIKSSASLSPQNSPSKSNSSNNKGVSSASTSFKDIICYVCLLPDIIGKFSVEKANEFGIVGSGRSKLCKGESVFSEKAGRLIKPEDVLSPSTIGPAIIVIACPRVEYLEGILNNSSITSFSTSERSGCIVHMVPEEIFSLPEYCDFVSSFSSGKWQHIVLNEACAYQELTIPSAHLVNGLNEVAPIFYPKLFPYSNAKPLPLALSKMPNVQRGRFHQSIMVNPLSPQGHPLIDNTACTENIDTNFSFEKKSSSNDSSPVTKKIKSLDINSSSVTSSPRTLSTRGQFLKSTEQMIDSFSDKELEVTFLGTCCSQTSLFREETCILLNMFEKGAMLFDVGGGAYSQLFRKYGKEESDKILINLRFIFLSHLHVDHHQGLYKLLEMRHLALEESYVPYEKRQLIVLAPQGAGRYIRELEKTMSFYSYPWKYITFYNFQNYQEDKQLSTFMKQKLGISKCIAVPVIHNFNAHGIVVESESGWKVSYSGDTKFCQQFVDAAVDSTILIHEATFHDHQTDKAQTKSHSTFSEAIKAYRNSNSFSTVLTHFSQRYPNLQETFNGDTNDSNNDEAFNNITFAFDFLTINIKNLSLLPGALDSLKIDPNDDEEVEDLDEI
ncbi:hypothetical protein DICPUDRAFT_153836 [Dictyostelium purpureum]|uniref:ribonuclease Z n=1 Tax=Dictyostelium purpureum TaxID=5786 RepID=F0ZPV4_DICPU|nr:uncharacterized protein DICPUDRAFT_153836 [Dictyostelium purpureum]EGC34044.1 hypothetical protein DICPUDRAFT_153836 [Dictyostelium purpureum]|eukprot:XP_003289448.1 hypothetical protein DICPUDRAFT_153836 [Dictyostelium purpureum]